MLDTSYADQRTPPVEDAILAVEVVSKDSKVRDVYDKAGMFAAAGVKHYWVIDPPLTSRTGSSSTCLR